MMLTRRYTSHAPFHHPSLVGDLFLAATPRYRRGGRCRCEKLRKQVLGLGIELERVLERLDLIMLTAEQSDVRKARRTVIEAVQKYLDRADQLTTSISIAKAE